MNRKRQIIIIKKKDLPIVQTTLIRKKTTEKDKTHKIPSTVTEWVKEFQQRPKY